MHTHKRIQCNVIKYLHSALQGIYSEALSLLAYMMLNVNQSIFIRYIRAVLPNLYTAAHLCAACSKNFQ